MNSLFIVGGVLVIVIFISFLFIYNRLIRLNNNVREAFATMDVYLKKRWDLVPNIVKFVREYTKYEKETLKEITALRKNNYDDFSQDEKIHANEKMNRELSKLMYLVESYPSLKANDNFMSLTQEFVSIENDIAQSRKYFNAVVRDYNNLVEMIPSNMVAKIFGYKVKAMFSIDENEKENVVVKD